MVNSRLGNEAKDQSLWDVDMISNMIFMISMIVNKSRLVLACLLEDISCIRFGQRSLSFHQPQGCQDSDQKYLLLHDGGSKIWVAC